MKNFSSGGLIALMVLALPACASVGKPANCTNACEVTVMVAGNTCGAGIAVAPDPLIIEGSAKVTWKVVGDWTFDENGVSSGYIKVMKEKDRYTAVIPGGQKGVYVYDVNLLRKGEKCSRDPTIIMH
jgi:hypothetical protein